jgi:hypothetical protein
LISENNSPISGFLFDLMVEGWPPRHFLFLLLAFMRRDSALYRNSGNRQERIILASAAIST